MNLPIVTSLTALQLYEPDAALRYSLEAAAQLAHVPRRRIAVYCRHGLVAPVMDPEAGGWYFNDEAIRRLRQLEQLRAAYDLNDATLRLVVGLMEEVESLQRELRLLRGR
jgi:DNA-binding transcriptional MerR regulator